MRRMFLMSSVLLAAPFYAGTAEAEVCIAEEDCNNLGYTEDKSCTDGLKCPFGEKWHCPDKKCQIGWILNSDMSCTENVESGKTPIAVVVYLDDNGNGQAMTPSPTAQSIVWSTEEKATGVPQLPFYTDAWNDFGSCSNTVKAMMNGDSQKYPAPWSAKTYAPSAAASTKGQWCLPAAGVLHSTYENRKIIDAAIQKLGGEVLQNNRNQIWSSTESDKTFMYIFTVYSEGSGLALRGKGQSSATVVRPVIEFNIDTGAAECKKLPDETGCTYGTESGDDTCGGTRKVCAACTPRPDDSFCQYGTEVVSDGCGGTRLKCKSPCTIQLPCYESVPYFYCSCYGDEQKGYRVTKDYRTVCWSKDPAVGWTAIVHGADREEKSGYIYASKKECYDANCPAGYPVIESWIGGHSIHEDYEGLKEEDAYPLIYSKPLNKTTSHYYTCK